MIGFILWILCIVGCVKVAGDKNRSTVGWGIAAFLFGPIPLIILVLLDDAY